MTTSFWALPALSHMWAYLVVGIVAILGAVIAVVLLVLPASRKEKVKAEKKQAHHDMRYWQKLVSQVGIDFNSGSISQAEAYSRLAQIARNFASSRLGVDLSSSTLLDLNQRVPLGSKQQFQQLRQTIAALYPPEFAHAATNAAADEASVAAAMNWVNNLIERWNNR